ncbi:MAG: DinB family protein [Chloroflexota bacterium]
MQFQAMVEWQISQLEKGSPLLENLLTGIPSKNMQIFVDGGKGWTVTEVLCHLRDFEAVFLERARMTVNEDNPALPFPDPEELAREKKYNRADPRKVLKAWQAIRAEHVAFLQARGTDDWERPAQHPTRGNFTLSDQLFLTVWHDTNHIEQIARILAEEQYAG